MSLVWCYKLLYGHALQTSEVQCIEVVLLFSAKKKKVLCTMVEESITKNKMFFNTQHTAFDL